jgi:hypothetical protein
MYLRCKCFNIIAPSSLAGRGLGVGFSYLTENISNILTIQNDEFYNP